MPRTECLSDTELKALLLGDLPDEVLDEATAHMEVCPKCEAAAQTLDHLADPRLTPFQRLAQVRSLENAALPSRVGDYVILEEVARGGMGVVYRARHVHLQRLAALKMLQTGAYADPEERRRFRAEAEVVAQFQHPHIVQIFDIGEWHTEPLSPPIPYIALEFVEGGNLSAQARARPQPPREAAACLEALARAVHYAHEQGIVHRDIKPSNILLTRDGEPKLCDFGIAKRLSGSDIKTRSGLVIGTAEYMAPEQADGRSAIGPAADIYALGGVLYTLLAGHPPFQGENPLGTIQQVLTLEPIRLRRLRPQLPRDLETICLKCLAKDPPQRYATAAALAEDLRRYRAGEPILARPVGLVGTLTRWCRRQPLLASLVVALLTVTLAGFVGILWQLQITEKEREKAVGLAAELRRERDTAEWQSYRANLSAATGAFQKSNLSAAGQFLNSATKHHRDWEWYHLIRRLDQGSICLRGHTGYVVSLAFRPDGRELVSGSHDGTVRFWDPATGNLLLSGSSQGGSVRRLVYAPRGRMLASAHDTGEIFLWDGKSENPKSKLSTSGRFNYHLSFSEDGKKLFSSSQKGIISVWDLATIKEECCPEDLGSEGRILAVHPDGKQLALAASDPRVRLWNIETGRVVAFAVGHVRPPFLARFHPNGTRLLTVGQEPDNSIRLWDSTTGQPLASYVGHQRQIITANFSPDGSRFVTTSQDRTARLWDGTSARPLAVLSGHTGEVTDAVFSPDNSRVATTSVDQSLRVWDAGSGAPQATLLGHDGSLWVVTWSPDGSRLATGSADHTIRLWDAKRAVRSDVLRGHTGSIHALAFHPEGNVLASAAWDHSVRLWNVTSNETLAIWKHMKPAVSSIAFTPDGRHLATLARWDQEIDLLDTKTGTRVQTLSAAGTLERFLAINPEGTLLAAAGHDGTIPLWNLRTGERVAVLKGHNSWVNCLAFHPQDSRLVSGGGDGTVRVWDVTTAQQLTQLEKQTTVVYGVAWSPDGATIATAGGDRRVRLYDTSTDTQFATLEIGRLISSVQFLSGGRRLAVGCLDGALLLWDLEHREEVAEFQDHRDAVLALTVSRDGTYLATSSGDLSIRLWNGTSMDGFPSR